MTLTLQDIDACTACGRVYKKAFLQEIRLILPKKGVQIVARCCVAHRQEYDTTTTTSGYHRYYLDEKEVFPPSSGWGDGGFHRACDGCGGTEFNEDGFCQDCGHEQ